MQRVAYQAMRFLYSIFWGIANDDRSRYLRFKEDAYDRGYKFGHYQTVKTLHDFLLVSQKDQKVALCPQGKWVWVAFDLHRQKQERCSYH